MAINIQAWLPIGGPDLIPKSCLIHMVTFEMDQIFMHLAICAAPKLSNRIKNGHKKIIKNIYRKKKGGGTIERQSKKDIPLEVCRVLLFFSCLDREKWHLRAQ